MVQLYVSDSVSRISFADGRVIVWSEELGESQYPIETLDGITLFGRPTMTTPFIVEMLKRERDIQLFTDRVEEDPESAGLDSGTHVGARRC